MAIPVLILGKSGSGKSASLRNCVGHDFAVINVLGKPFPFRGKLPAFVTDDYQKIMKTLVNTKIQKSIVIDDAGYLITNAFMRGHSGTGSGNAVYAFYNTLADNFWNLIEFIRNSVPADRIVYMIMHEDVDDFGNVKPKTIGKLLDEKVTIEGMFTIVLRSTVSNGQYVFKTESDGLDVAKTPIGMFSTKEIPNDIYAVDQAIREYYEIGETEVNHEE